MKKGLYMLKLITKGSKHSGEGFAKLMIQKDQSEEKRREKLSDIMSLYSSKL